MFTRLGSFSEWRFAGADDEEPSEEEEDDDDDELDSILDENDKEEADDCRWPFLSFFFFLLETELQPRANADELRSSLSLRTLDEWLSQVLCSLLAARLCLVGAPDSGFLECCSSESSVLTVPASDVARRRVAEEREAGVPSPSG